MSRPSRIAIVKELGSRTPRCLAAHAVRGNDVPELVVVERYPSTLGAEALAIIEEDSKNLVPLEQGSIATLISTAKLKGDVAVLSEWVDGESLASILACAQKPDLEIVVRAFLDVLEALGALHASGDRVCGALTPEDVFVGVDGVTRVTRFNLGRVPPALLPESRTAYMAPEFLKGERNPRIDVFTAGALLRECAPSLDAIVEKACAENPSARYATMREMAEATTSAAVKIATRATVSVYIARVFGERIAARLAKLEPKGDMRLPSINSPPTTEPPPAVEVTSPSKLPAVVIVPKEKDKPPERPPENVEKPSEKVAEKAPEKVPEKTSTPRIQLRKPMGGAPAVAATSATPAQKKAVVPLPKRPNQEAKAVENRVVKRNDSSERSEVSAEPVAIATKPTQPTKANGDASRHAVPKPAKVSEDPKPVDIVVVEGPVEQVPPSERDDIDVDVDIVSVRPPPIATPKKQKSLRPAPKAETKVEVVAAQAATETSEGDEKPAPSNSRGLLIALVGIIVFCGGFFAGRFTTTDPEPATTTTATATATVTVTATASTPTPTTTTSATVSASSKPAPVTSAATTTTPRIVEPLSATKSDASARYAPSGI